MSESLISRSPDLKRLRDDGYEIEVRSGHLLMKSVPYVTANRTIKRASLVSELSLAGDVTTRPGTHTAMFTGEMPCDPEGRKLSQIRHSSGETDLGGGVIGHHQFSSKPNEGYHDYYEKMVSYEGIISGQAQLIDPTATAKTFSVMESPDEDSVFWYMDTATSRAGIGAVSQKLSIGAVAIVGLGGSGSYILDLVAKTPVREIHLFDGDRFGQHNAFRSPGAPHIDTLRQGPPKVDYFRDLYSPMRRNIFAHGYLEESTVDSLRHMEFVFVAVDTGPSRKLVVQKLLEFGISFIDVGMGVEEVDGALLGTLRVTACTPQAGSHIASTVPVSGGDGDDVYDRNIQIADLNALSAALAVIKWKKLMGFYVDLEHEHSCYYNIDGNHLLNEDQA